MISLDDPGPSTTRTCSVHGCPNDPRRQSMCSTHRTRLRNGQPLDTPILTRTERARRAGLRRAALRQRNRAGNLIPFASDPCAWCGTAPLHHDRCGLCGMLACAREDYGPPAAYCRSCQRVRDERRRNRVTATPMVTIAIGRQEDR